MVAGNRPTPREQSGSAASAVAARQARSLNGLQLARQIVRCDERHELSSAVKHGTRREACIPRSHSVRAVTCCGL